MMRSRPGRPVIVAHGLWMPGPETIVLRRRLAGAGFTPHLFRYRTVGATLDESAAALAGLAATIGTPGADLIGYSLGGVVVLTMLTRFRPEHDGRVVCLGSPLKGSRAARRLARVPGGGRVLGLSMLDLLEQGGFARWRGAQAVGVIAGDLGLGIGRLLGGLPVPNDGTVAVAETRLEGAAHIVLPVSHTSLMFSRRVADETVHFLRHGAFSLEAA